MSAPTVPTPSANGVRRYVPISNMAGLQDDERAYLQALTAAERAAERAHQEQARVYRTIRWFLIIVGTVIAAAMVVGTW